MQRRRFLAATGGLAALLAAAPLVAACGTEKAEATEARADVPRAGAGSGDARAFAGASTMLGWDLYRVLAGREQGNMFLSPRVAGWLVRRSGRTEPAANVPPAPASRIDALTPREREVFQLLALGKSNKEVARALDMSLGTAKKHRENLQRKLDCHSAAELALLAIREGLLGT